MADLSLQSRIHIEDRHDYLPRRFAAGRARYARCGSSSHTFHRARVQNLAGSPRSGRSV
jgi:hypothetical protein